MSQLSQIKTPSIQIAVINESTVLSDADVVPIVAALQKQVTNDFRPVWGVDAALTITAAGTPPPTGSWWLVLLDDSDQASALGYHDLTTEGLPIGKVFAASDIKPELCGPLPPATSSLKCWVTRTSTSPFSFKIAV